MLLLLSSISVPLTVVLLSWYGLLMMLWDVETDRFGKRAALDVRTSMAELSVFSLLCLIVMLFWSAYSMQSCNVHVRGIVAVLSCVPACAAIVHRRAMHAAKPDFPKNFMVPAVKMAS